MDNVSGLSSGDGSQVSPGKACIEDAECLDIVRFPASEYIYVCHKSTLLKYPNSRLAQFIKPENDTRKSGSDHIVVDRNGKLFGVILRLMMDSTDKWWEDLKGSEIDDLVNDLNFFQLDDLKKCVAKKEEKFIDEQVELLDGSVTYYYQNTILITPKSLKAFGDDWQNMSKQLRASGKFWIYISDYGYRGVAVSKDEPEVFRFFLPDDSDEDERDSLPRLTCDEKDKTYGDLICTTKSGTSIDNFSSLSICS